MQIRLQSRSACGLIFFNSFKELVIEASFEHVALIEACRFN
jgi:hypothetical protein